ncbi:MAG: hypothetical protein ACRD1H_06620 [Vicinamibacterales bacterium]
MIDKLPLDIFEDPEPQTLPAPALATDPLAPAADEAEPVETASPTTGRSQRIYDGIAVIGLAIGLGIVLRAIGLGVLTPVVNIAIAFVVYRQAPAEQRAGYFRQMETLRKRLEREAVNAQAQTAPLPSEMRVLYDGLALVCIGAAGALLAFLLGINQWLPMAWLFLTAAGAGAYVWMGRDYRPGYYALAERARQRLMASWNSAGHR